MDIYTRIRKPTAKPTIPHKDKKKYTRKEKHFKIEEKKMSGAYFGHQQYSMSIIADEIEDAMEPYSDKTKHILKKMMLDLRDMKNKVTKLDCLLSGYISEEEFLKDYY